MQKVFGGLLLSAVLVTTTAWAQSEGVTEREVSEVTRGVFQSPVTISPRIGSMGFANANGDYTSKIMEGLTLNWNPTQIAQVGGLNLGVETGLLFSHIGAPGSTWLGTNGPGSGANSFMFPLNLVVGYHVSDKVLVAVDLGANAIYRSVSNSMQLGRAADSGSGSSTEFFPSAGLNVGWSLGRSFGLSLRGDYIPTPSQDMYTASLGATLPLA